MRGLVKFFGVALIIATWVVIFGPVNITAQKIFNPPVFVIPGTFFGEGASGFLNSIFTWISLIGSVIASIVIWKITGQIIGPPK